MDAEYSGNKPGWTFLLNVVNTCANPATQIRITSVEIWTLGIRVVNQTGLNLTLNGGASDPDLWSYGKVNMTTGDSSPNFSSPFQSQAEARCWYAPIAPVNEVQTVTVTQPVTSYRLEVNTGSTEQTDLIPGNASALDVQNALLALPNLGPGDVSVSGPNGGPYTITFQFAIYGDMGVKNKTGAGSVVVATTTNSNCGRAPCYGNPITELWQAHPPCVRLNADTTYALVRFEQRLGTSGTFAPCGTDAVRVDFKAGSKCGTTAGICGPPGPLTPQDRP